MSQNTDLTTVASADDLNEPILRVADLAAGYGKVDIISDVNVGVESGEIVCIIGPNGAGKSTLLKSIVGSSAVQLSQGSIHIHDHDITHISAHEALQFGLSYMPQGSTVFPYMDVDEHLNMGGWILDSAEIKRQKEVVLDMFPRLRDVRDSNARNMSGGEQQMLALARTLMIDPDLLILDEPSLGLAPNLVDLILETIQEIRDQGTSVLMVEQDAVRALETSDRGYVLDRGTPRFEGDASELLTDEDVQNLYLGM